MQILKIFKDTGMEFNNYSNTSSKAATANNSKNLPLYIFSSNFLQFTHNFAIICPFITVFLHNA